MKNLKRVLSLALAGTMLSGMMAMGASAADTSDFTDADEIVNVEAVNVMSTLGVLKGKDTGAFDPTATVTRAEMAKIITVMRNGGVDPTLGSTSSVMFTDIQNHWAKSYIQYCANLGIIAGMGDGTFGPDLPVTGAAAAKMLLVALGYDADIAGYTGADWDLNVNRDANKAKLYDGIETIDTSAGLSRDNTAQMAYNTLDAKIMERTDNKVLGTGEISYSYEQSKTTSFLNEYFKADTFIGTFEATAKTDDGIPAGQMKVYGQLDNEEKKERSATFVGELDIANLGEEVKVIFKDGKTGQKGTPDKNDTIFGVFNTGATQVYHITKNDLDDVKTKGGNGTDKDNATETKVKFNDAKYDLDWDLQDEFKVIYNYGVDEKTFEKETSGDSKLLDVATYFMSTLEKKSGDTIKLIANDNGKIYRAYVVESNLGRITSTTASKITISGVGAIEIEDNDVAEGLKKDDVVVYTKLYESEKDDATFTVVKAETLEGELSAYVTGDPNYKSITVDGKKTNVQLNKLTANLTDDTIVDLSDYLKEDVVAYLVNGMVGAVDKVDNASSSWALAIGATQNSTSTTHLSDGKVRLLLSDGTKATYVVDEDSDLQPEENFKAPCLVKYSVNSDGTVDIKEVGQTKSYINNAKIWNDSTKSIETVGVAASGALAYVLTEASNTNPEYKVYDLRGLKTQENKSGSAMEVGYVTDTTGKVVAVYLPLDGTPSGATKDTRYGMVTSDPSVTKIDGTSYTTYTIWAGNGVDEEGESLTVNIKGSKNFSKGTYVMFDESNDGNYSNDAIEAVAAKDGVRTVFNGAVKEYSSSDAIISYHEKVQSLDGGKTFKGLGVKTVALDDDCVVVYVNRDDKKGTPGGTIEEFNTATGYANIKMVADKDGVIVAAFVETSGECDIDGAKAHITSANPVELEDVVEKVSPEAGKTVALPNNPNKLNKDSGKFNVGDEEAFNLAWEADDENGTLKKAEGDEAAIYKLTFKAGTKITKVEKFVTGTTDAKITSSNEVTLDDGILYLIVTNNMNKVVITAGQEVYTLTLSPWTVTK